MSHGIVNISDDSFEEEVLKAEGPVLVDYWAEWCGPCKIIAPVLQEIAAEYQGKLKVAKLNIDENPQTPPKYGIRGIPTLMLFKNGASRQPRWARFPSRNWLPSLTEISRMTRGPRGCGPRGWTGGVTDAKVKWLDVKKIPRRSCFLQLS